MSATRTATVQIGPFSAPLGPVAAAVIHRFVGEADFNGWLAVARVTDEGIVVSAVRIEPRTVRQRITKPAPAGTGD